jgi:hypothetical protein
MILASKALTVHHLHHLLGPWMERIKNPDLKRRTPGIVTLSRLAQARRIWPSPLPEAASEPVPAVGFTT